MSDTCHEFKVVSNYDMWVVSHQVLPAMAMVIGIRWNDIFLLMYTWETLEVILLNCMQVSSPEFTSNALISDPAQCLVGVLVGKALINQFNNGQVLIVDTMSTLVWSLLFGLPSIPLWIGDEYVWGYIPIYLTCLAALWNHMPNKGLVAALAGYVVTISVLIFAIEDSFNSFYIAMIWGLAIAGVSMIYNNNVT